MTVAKIHVARQGRSLDDLDAGEPRKRIIDPNVFIAGQPRPSPSPPAKRFQDLSMEELSQKANEITRRKVAERLAAQVAAKAEEERRRQIEEEISRRVEAEVARRMKSARRQWIRDELNRPWVRSAAILLGLLAIALAISSNGQRYTISNPIILDSHTGKWSPISDAPRLFPASN